MMDRKKFLKSMAFGALSTSVLVAACGGDAPKTETKTEAPTEPAAEPAAAQTTSADCNDVSGLAEADVKQRESVSYVAKSVDPEKNCGNCRFMKPNSEPNGCNGCQLFKGPVNPEGNCKSWFKKDA
jgi:hypothetical protein